MPERPNDGKTPEPTYEDRVRYAMRRDAERRAAAQRAMDQAGAAADGLMKRIADIRKREAAEAAELLADAIARKMQVAPVEATADKQAPGTSTAGLPSVNEQPRQLLTGWHEITASLNMKHADRDKIKHANERFDGPIRNSGKGTKPMVCRDDLIQWWNRLTVQAEELANQQEGKKLSAGAQHNYGRDGIAAPEIGGEVKKRRSDRKRA